MNDDSATDFARIRPVHAGDGWVFEQTERGPQLVKDYGGYGGRIRATAGTTCVWTIRGCGAFREASEQDGVEAAKSAADEWIANRPDLQKPPHNTHK